MMNTADERQTAGPLGARQLAPRIYALRARRLALRVQPRARGDQVNELRPRQVAAKGDKIM